MPAIPLEIVRSGDALFALNKHQRIIQWNSAAESLFRLPAADVLGEPCYRVLNCHDRGGNSICDRNCLVFTSVIEGKDVESKDVLIQLPNGESLGCNYSVLAIGGTRASAVMLFRRSEAVHLTNKDVAPHLFESRSLGVRCFGSFEVLRHGVPDTTAPLSRVKVQRALRYLVHYRGRKVTKDELAEIVWPGCDPDSVRTKLKVLIHDLRHALERDLEPYQRSRYVASAEGGYEFMSVEDCPIDVDLYLALVHDGEAALSNHQIDVAERKFLMAVKLYRGEYLPEELYEDWCSGERERLRVIYLSALNNLAYALAGRREFGAAIEYCRSAISNDGCRETSYRSMMEYQWAIGRGHEALQTYQQCEETLMRELDVPPASETTALYHRIQNELRGG